MLVSTPSAPMIERSSTLSEPTISSAIVDTGITSVMAISSSVRRRIDKA
jgi:hypothetical protein